MNVLEPIIKQSTIDFANKWNVGVNLLSEQEYSNYTVDASRYHFFKSPFQGRWGIKWSKHNADDRTIVMSNCSYNAEKNTDRIIFHELCHAIFEVKPNMINDIKSPLMSLDINMINHFGVSNNFNSGPGYKYISSVIGANTIEEYHTHFNNELIEQGILTEDGQYTFDRSKVKPKDVWYKTN